MKNKLFAPLFTIACACALLMMMVGRSHKNDQPADSVAIMAEIRPEENYVTHLYTLAELGFRDSAYAAEYGASLPQSAIDTLQKYRTHLVFGQGEGGILAGPFFFGVSAENIPCADSMQVLFDHLMEEGRRSHTPESVLQICQSVSEVYVAYYDAYLRDVYPRAKADMQDRMKELNARLAAHSFVADWERVTGYTWTHGDYHWLLYRAGEHGPSYNNLNENTNTVYYNQSLDYQLAMFSHEFGIFLMMDSINPVMEEMKAYTRSLESDRDLTFVPWSAFESLSCWYNCKIAGNETEDYRNFGEADVEKFSAIYDDLEQKGIKDPAELYRKAILEYISAK